MANSPEGVIYSPCVVEYSPIGMLALGRLSCVQHGGRLFYCVKSLCVENPAFAPRIVFASLPIYLFAGGSGGGCISDARRFVLGASETAFS